MAELDIVAFLRSCLDEREEQYSNAPEVYGWELADVKAKRQIIELCATETDETGGRPLAIRTLRLLALPYAEHPDYQERWRP